MSRKVVRIGRHLIGQDHEPLVVAEISGNHGGSLDRALELVRLSARAGVHAVKLQTYTPQSMTLDLDTDGFRVPSDHPLWGGRSLWDLYSQAQTPWEWHEPLIAEARRLGIECFSSPFDIAAVALLDHLDVPAFKIASSEIVDLPLIREVARRGRPLIISCGMATLGEVDSAVQAASATGNDQIVLLACTASYPADARDANLLSMATLASTFGLPVGLSDHTPGLGVPVAAAALGAALVEKHVRLDSADGAPDREFSLNPSELAALVVQVSEAWHARGAARVGPTEREAPGRLLRRSLYVAADVRAGDVVNAENVRSIRPGRGLAPDLLSVVTGRRFTRDVQRGTPLSWDVL